MTDVEWTDEAREAVARAIEGRMTTDWVCPHNEDQGLAYMCGQCDTDVTCSALTPYVEAMVREARAEAMSELALVARQRHVVAEEAGFGQPKSWRRVSQFLEARAGSARRGE